MEFPEYPKLGANIRALRLSYGETIDELAEAIERSTGSVSSYENMKSIPERDTIIKIAKHYRVTETELLYGDFSGRRSLAKEKINNNERSIDMLNKLFPIICTDTALENKAFQEAYRIHMQFYQAVINQSDLDESFSNEIDRCMELYDKAIDQGIVEGAANRLWFMFVNGTLSVFAPTELIEGTTIFQNKDATFKDFFRHFLPTFFEDDGVPIEERMNEGEKNRIAFVEECEVPIYVEICRLKKTKEYADLGDYYLGLKYLFSFCNNGNTPEMNTAIGADLISSFRVLQNPYAAKFFE